jgi:hypothetical protein
MPHSTLTSTPASSLAASSLLPSTHGGGARPGHIAAPSYPASTHGGGASPAEAGLCAQQRRPYEGIALAPPAGAEASASASCSSWPDLWLVGHVASRTYARLPPEAPPHGLVCDGGGSPPFRSAPRRGAGVDSLPRCIRPHRRDPPPSSTPASAANRSTHHLGPLVNPHCLPHDSIPNLISLLLLFHSLGAQTRHRFASERGGGTSRARRSRRGMAVARVPSACVWA